LRASEGPARQFDGCCLGIRRPDSRELGKAGGGPTHGRMFRERPSAPQTSKKRARQCERRRWHVRPMQNQASALLVRRNTLSSRVQSLAPPRTVLAPRLFRCSTSASEWARAIIWLFGLAARACHTTCPASKASGIAIITYFAPGGSPPSAHQVALHCQRLPQYLLLEDQT
jgi:hypothetical protein